MRTVAVATFGEGGVAQASYIHEPQCRHPGLASHLGADAGSSGRADIAPEVATHERSRRRPCGTRRFAHTTRRERESLEIRSPVKIKCG
jgi:hypothetical protein